MLPPQLSDATIDRITTVAAACWLVYDSLLVLDDEIRLIWRSKRSLPKFLYFICRYGGLASSIAFASEVSYVLVGGPSELTGKTSCVASTVMLFLQIPVSMAADGLLLLRVQALYRFQKYLCWFLFVFYVLETMVEIAISCADLYGAVLAETSYGMTCLDQIKGTSIQFFAASVPAIAFNATLFGLTVAKVLPYWRIHQFGMTPFLEAFVRDGALYFLMICCVLMVNIFLPLFLVSSILPVYFTNNWFYAVYPIAACRLLLELRCSVNRPTLEITMQSSHAHIPTFGVPTSQFLSEPVAETTDGSTLEIYTFHEA